MSQQLLLAACEQAQRAEPAVRAAALLRIARVMACSDQAAAEQLLEQGIGLAREIEGEAGSLLLHNAASLAAAVSAKHALPLYAEQRKADRFRGGAVVGLVNMLAEHGHVGDAIAYLRDPLPGDRFPLHFVNNPERKCSDDEVRRELLELAIREWRNPAPREGPDERSGGPSFSAFFGRYWNLLPREVAASVLRELVDWTPGMKSTVYEFKLTEDPEDPRLGSELEMLLFRLIPALQDLEPALARSVVEGRPRLAAAVRRFPLGWPSVKQSQPQWKYDPARDDVVVIGDYRTMEIAEALATDFEASFRQALEYFAKDMESPDRAYKEFWPSTREFRHILFKAGQHKGAAGAKHLDRVPDRDLRLFAQIELCVGIAGLPEAGGVITRHRRG